MKFASFLFYGRQSYGVVHENGREMIDVCAAHTLMENKALLPDTLQAGIETGASFLKLVTEIIVWAGENKQENFVYSLDNEGLQFLAPIVRPKKNVICIGKNYREHVLELGGEEDIPKALMVFTKAPTAVIGHKQEVLRHSTVTDCLDYEGELAVIIGRKGKNISPEEADSYVFGYTIINDITARDLQKEHQQFFLGKSLDTSCPMGPFLVTKDEIDNPHNLTIETKINREIRQSSNTKQMMFTIPIIISTISRVMTLEPGDIIATGTPSGVGKGYHPPKFLQAGDEIEVTVEGIGTLINVVSHE